MKASGSSGGVLLALLAATCADSREPSLWACDRAGGALLVLDRELCVLARLAADSPRCLATSDAGVWVACGSAGASGLPRRLSRFTLQRAVAPELDFSGIEDLIASAAGAVLVVERLDPGVRRLWRVDSGLQRELLGEFPGPCAVAVQGRTLLVGCATGECELLRADGAVLGFGSFPGPVRALARGPADGTWWVLGAGEPALLGLLSQRLEVLWVSSTGLATGRFAPVAGEERVWLADGERARRYGPAGELELDLALESSSVPYAAVLASRDRALLMGPGALLEIEVVGASPEVRRSQGGFGALSALAGIELR